MFKDRKLKVSEYTFGSENIYFRNYEEKRGSRQKVEKKMSL